MVSGCCRRPGSTIWRTAAYPAHPFSNPATACHRERKGELCDEHRWRHATSPHGSLRPWSAISAFWSRWLFVHGNRKICAFSTSGHDGFAIPLQAGWQKWRVNCPKVR